MTWTTIVIFFCIVLAIYLIWQEYSRPNRLRLPLRLLAAILAVVALACIALPISYKNKSIIGAKEGVLLTNGFNRDSLSVYQNSPLFTADASISKAYPKLKITSVADLGDFATGGFNVTKLHILGYGLTGDELTQLGSFPLQFHPAKIPTGITAINWTHHLKAGDRMHVQGNLLLTSNKVAIVLKGLNTTLDSATITQNANRSGDFSLKTTPKNTGKGTYNLLVLNGKDTLERETIPFEVGLSKSIKVLMLATSPDFENNFLKNWLSQHGYGVAVRTTISKDKFSREYFNMGQTPVDKLTPALLEKFDLLVGDLSEFKLLNAAENGAIQQQMMQKGLGVIVKADSSEKGTSFLANAFPMESPVDKTQKTTALLINGQDSPTQKLVIDAVFIQPKANTQPLVMDDQNHTVASSTIYGGGKIVFSILNDTYSWALSGDQGDYNALWSMLIDKAARKIAVTQKWSVLPPLPVVNQPATVITEGPVTLPLHVKVDSSLIAFSQNPAVPFSWQATYWPANYGWQQVTVNGATANWWYAYQTGDWQTLHAVEKQQAVNKYLNANKTGKTTTTQENEVSIPVSKTWFYAVLLLSCAYLWVERKL